MKRAALSRPENQILRTKYREPRTALPHCVFHFRDPIRTLQHFARLRAIRRAHNPIPLHHVDQVRRAIGLDRRIGPHFIFPGIGYGGSCFPKDVRALIAMADARCELPLLEAVDQVNERQKRILIEKVRSHFGADLSSRTFAVWGLSFKPHTDDMREAPSINLIEALLGHGASINAFDPGAMTQAQRIFDGSVNYCHRSYEALEGADALLICTEWDEFRSPEFQRIKKILRNPVIFDGRNIFDPAEMKQRGFIYYSIGRNHD